MARAAASWGSKLTFSGATLCLEMRLAAGRQHPAAVCVGRRTACHRGVPEGLACKCRCAEADPSCADHAGTSSWSACASPTGCAGSRTRLRPWPQRPPCTPSSTAASPGPTRAASPQSGSPSRTFRATPPPLWRLCWCRGVQPGFARWWPLPHAQRARAAFQRGPCKEARRRSLQVGVGVSWVGASVCSAGASAA